jgi:hypothetical protein
MLACDEWLQAIDYETHGSEDAVDKNILRFEPTVTRFLKSLEN